VSTDATYFLDRVTKFSAREFIPQAFDGRKVSGWNAFDFSEVDKVSTLLLGSSEDDKGVPGKLFGCCWFRRRESEMRTKVSTL
jgi:hypothetical protein